MLEVPVRSSTATSPASDSRVPAMVATDGRFWCLGPQHQHDQHRSQVLQQQCHADIQSLHRQEVAQLAGAHAEQSEEQDRHPVGAQQHPPSAHRQQRRDGQHQRRARHAGSYRGGRAPTGLEKPLGEGARQPEGGRGGQCNPNALRLAGMAGRSVGGSCRRTGGRQVAHVGLSRRISCPVQGQMGGMSMTIRLGLEGSQSTHPPGNEL